MDTFPAYSETFIRDQIISLISKGVDVKIYSRNKRLSEIGALTNFEKYNLLDRLVDINEVLPKNKLLRVIKALLILFNSIITKDFNVLVKTLNYKKYGKKSYNLWFFYFSNYCLKNKINIIHSHFGPIGLLGAKFKSIGLPIKLITTFHGYDIRLGYNKGFDYYNFLKNNGDYFISISKYNKKSLLEFGFDKNKIIDLPNGIDTFFYKKKMSKKRNKTIVLLTVARLVDEKNIELSLRAFSIIVKNNLKSDIIYQIIGDGPLENKLKKLAKNLGIEEKVQFLGKQNSFVIRDKMIESDLFILPSRAEAFPTVILEAQSCELPVIATDVGSIKDMIVNSGIVIESENLNELVKALNVMLANCKIMNKFGINGRKNVVENYDISNMTDKLIKIYNE